MNPNSKTAQFFAALNKAYREGRPYFEYYVSDWDSEEFLTLYRCLRHHYKLKLDMKCYREGNSTIPHEYFYVDLIHTKVDKEEGFVFLNIDTKMDEIRLKNKVPAVDKVEGNVIHVNFSKK